MLMELAYRLAVEDSPFIEAIRKNVIVMITPALEVDGRDRMVDLYNYRKANAGKPAPGLIYLGQVRCPRQQPRWLGPGAGADPQPDADVPRVPSARSFTTCTSRCPFSTPSTGTGPVQRLARSARHR